jgi:hypothetical protein
MDQTQQQTQQAPVPAVSTTGAPINVQASQNPSDPDHHFSLGQILATALVTLAAVQQARTQGATTFLDPAVTSQYLQGIESIWVQPGTGA